MNDSTLKLILLFIVLIIFVLLGVLAFIYYKDKMAQNKEEASSGKNGDNTTKTDHKSVFRFMEFDEIEDNMIVQDNGTRFLMVIECKGINYDLLSGVEKTSVEEGFMQFLNTLKSEIQLYIQTRKINLSQSTAKYRERLEKIRLDFENEQRNYDAIQNNPNATREEVLKSLKELTKKRNLYEYGKDIVENTEQMSEDRDITTKQYYIVIPYYTDEITSSGDFDKREINNMAFSELYTRAQSIVAGLTECEVRGRILNSEELVELLYVAYNREQYDIYDFDSYMNKSGYQSLYSVSEDVLDKKMKALDEEIKQKATNRVVEAFEYASEAKKMKMRAFEERMAKLNEIVDDVSEKIVDNEVNTMGAEIASMTKAELVKMKKKRLQRESSSDDKFENNEVDKVDGSNVKSIDLDDLEEKKDESIVKDTVKKKRVLTEEEKKRLIAIKKKKLLLERKKMKEREANVRKNNESF